ncbi:MAG: SAM-dependent chlorinase/fluorinase [Thermodesulfobacteriota bacterium]
MCATRVITLLTDFGTRDIYAGVMKGVILSICPDVRLIDLTHEIPPQDIRAAAWQVSASYKYFPKGSIHVAVVDPGVGTSRRPILVVCDGHFFIGPDNGLFSLLYQSGRPFDVYVLSQKKYFLDKISATFHGRDIFAPVAGHLACGTPPEELGERITDPVTLGTTKPEFDGRTLYGKVVWTDRFGNLITSISEEEFKKHIQGKPFVIKAGSISLKFLQKTYAGARGHGIIALFGSSGLLEIAEVSGSAARRLKMGAGAAVTVTIENNLKEIEENRS